MKTSTKKYHKHPKSSSKEMADKKGKKSNCEVSKPEMQIVPAVKRIPVEIWDMITSHVDSSPDLRNLGVAVPICGKLLEPKKTEWIFDHVLPVVLTNTCELTRKDIINCRAVCRRWKYAVDYLFEIETAVMQDFSDDSNPRQDLGYLGLQRYLGHYGMLPEEVTPAKMSNMLKEFEKCTENPLFGRYLELTIPASSRKDRRIILRFLKTFGHHVYFVDVNCKRETHPQVFISLLLKLLNYMPNIKHIGLGKCHWPTEENWVVMGNQNNLRQHCDEILAELPPLKAPIHSLILQEAEIV